MEHHAPFLACVDGVDAALIRPTPERDDSDLLGRALGLLAATDEPAIRLVLGDRTVLVQREGSHAAVASWSTGHDVSKSIRRTIRRLAERKRARHVPRYVVEAKLADIDRQIARWDRELLGAVADPCGAPPGFVPSAKLRIAELGRRRALVAQALTDPLPPDDVAAEAPER
jgi:hypothetical protein